MFSSLREGYCADPSSRFPATILTNVAGSYSTTWRFSGWRLPRTGQSFICGGTEQAAILPISKADGLACSCTCGRNTNLVHLKKAGSACYPLGLLSRIIQTRKCLHNHAQPPTFHVKTMVCADGFLRISRRYKPTRDRRAHPDGGFLFVVSIVMYRCPLTWHILAIMRVCVGGGIIRRCLRQRRYRV
jgi:hypothetical protein